MKELLQNILIASAGGSILFYQFYLFLLYFIFNVCPTKIMAPNCFMNSFHPDNVEKLQKERNADIADITHNSVENSIRLITILHLHISSTYMCIPHICHFFYTGKIFGE